MSTDALQRAIIILGGQTALARRLEKITGRKVHQRNVWSWLNRTRRVPPEFAIPIEQATGGEVTRHEIRADLYPMEGNAA